MKPFTERYRFWFVPLVAAMAVALALPAGADDAKQSPPQGAKTADTPAATPLRSLATPTAWPGGIPAGQTSEVRVSVLLLGPPPTPPASIKLDVSGRREPISLADDGTGADLTADDGLYSGTVSFTVPRRAEGQCFDLRAYIDPGPKPVPGKARKTRTHWDDEQRAEHEARTHRGRDDDRRLARHHLSDPVTSPTISLCATTLPIGISASNTEPANLLPVVENGVKGEVLADEIMIVVREGVSGRQITTTAARVGATIVGGLPAYRLYQLRLAEPQTPAELAATIAQLANSPGIVTAVPHAVGELAAPPVLPVTTNDPDLGLQWGLDRIRGRHAWALSGGNPTTIIAVVDTGADFDHPDFWSTPTGTDTRFTASGSNFLAADCVSSGCADVSKPLSCHASNACNTANGATDTYGHGTLVAGLASAAVDNSLGIAGITRQGRVLAVRYVAGAFPTAAKLAESIDFAVSRGARIVSVSSAFPLASASFTICPPVAAADSAGRLVAAAAGNDGGTGNNYPGACAGALPIANSNVNGTDQDVIHSGTLPSNYGAWIAVAAPGAAVLSTARSAATCATCDPAYVSPTGYLNVTGTSFSTPLAAGAAALIIARAPSITNADLRALLASTGVALQAPAAHIRRIDLLPALLSFNAAPTAIGLTPTAIDENTDSTAGASVGTLSTTDADAGLTGHEYAIVGGVDAALFSIGGSGNDQLVITDGVLDFETKNSYQVRVRSTDVGNLGFEQDFTVTVNDIDEPPVIPDTSFVIPENSANGSIVGTVGGLDPEGNPVSFSITGGNTGGAFSITPAGEIRVASSAALNFETTPGFALTVTGSDGTLSTPATITVNLSDVNEAPVVGTGAFTVAENSANGTVVGTVSAADPEAAPLSFAITGGNTGGAFAVSPSGQITVANAVAVDFETTPVFTLTLNVGDGTHVVATTVTVTLTDVVEAIPNPILVFDVMETGTDALGNTVDRYFFNVSNWASYPQAMFDPRPDLPPCGDNTAASRTWVDFFDASNDARLYGFCALGTPANLNGIWFGVIPSGAPHPAAVYVKFFDRETGLEYTSNVVTIP